MYALIKMGMQLFSKKTPNYSFTPMPSGVGVKEVFAACRRHAKLSFKKRVSPS